MAVRYLAILVSMLLLALTACGMASRPGTPVRGQPVAAPSPARTMQAELMVPSPATATVWFPPPPTPRTTDPPLVGGQIGVGAITPHLTPTAPGQPTFTEEDVRAYLAHGLDLFRLRPVGPYRIDRVVFLSQEEAEAQFGVLTGVPEDHHLCLAIIRGPFSLTGPSVPGRTPTPYIYEAITIIFDAYTGNQLGEEAKP